MRIGFALPQHGSAATPEGLSTIARWAEALGFDSLWVWDRLLAPTHPRTPYPMGGAHPDAFRSVLDPIAALTYVAAVTERVALGTSVLVLPLYNPVVLARQLTAIDVLSSGRLRIGLGVGWNEDEIEASGVPFAERGRRADEALRLMKAIWTEDPVEFQGKFYQLPASHIQTKPIQKPHPPIYLGAYTPASMRRLALEANGWNVVGVPLSAVPAMFEEIRRLARAAGRDPASIELVVRANLVPSPEPLGPDRADFHGTLEQITADVHRARELGASELFFDLWTAHPEVDTLDQWLSWMQKLYSLARSA